MKSNHDVKWAPIGWCALAGVGLWAGAAHAQERTRSVYLYNGAIAASAILDVWGNGVVAKARDVDYEGSDTARITTRNLNEGVRFDLKQPVEIGPYLQNGFVRLRVRFQAAAARTPRGGAGAPGGGIGVPGMGVPGAPAMGDAATEDFQAFNFPNETRLGAAPDAASVTYRALAQQTPQQRRQELARQELLRQQLLQQQQGGGENPGMGGFPAGAPGMGMPGGGAPGMGMPGGAPGGRGNRRTRQAPATPIKRIQVMLMLDKGVMSGGIDVDLQKNRPDENGWRLLVLPIKEMRATRGASGSIRRVIVTSDKEDSWYLAQAALTVESGDITVSIRPTAAAPNAQVAEITIAPGPITLIADVEAGAADPIVEWNFDADNVGNMTPPAGAGAPGMGAPAGIPGAGVPTMTGAPTGIGGPAGMGGPALDGAGAPVGDRSDARGLVAKFEYPNEEQNYRVEVTVRDRAGKKAPATASILVKVRG